MKKYNRALFPALCCIFFALSLRLTHGQTSGNASVASAGEQSVAVVFPLRVSEQSSAAMLQSEISDSQALKPLLQAALADPQGRSDGSPFPEASSLAALTAESLRTKTDAGNIASIDLDTLRVQLSSGDDIHILDSPFAQKAKMIYFMVYTLQDSRIHIFSFLLKKDGGVVQYATGPISIFGLSDASNEAVDYFVGRGLLPPTHAQGTATNALSQQNIILPKIEPWTSEKQYQKARDAFKFAIGGVAIGFSASFVGVGTWQMYREAEYRNSAFGNAVTISGIAAGTCIAVTVAFLASAIANAASMLSFSR